MALAFGVSYRRQASLDGGEQGGMSAELGSVTLPLLLSQAIAKSKALPLGAASVFLDLRDPFFFFFFA